MIPSLGRTVHYVLDNEQRHKGQHRAARIVQVWNDKGQDVTEVTPVALLVDLDPLNDPMPKGIPFLTVKSSTQDPYGKQAGSWHEPERVDTPAMRAERDAEQAKRAAKTVKEPAAKEAVAA